MHLGNAFVRYLCVIIFKLFLVIQIMRIFLKIENLDILTSFSIAWRVDRVELRNRWFESISSRVTMLISSIRVGSESWYRVFGPGQKVGTDSRPGDQSTHADILYFFRTRFKLRGVVNSDRNWRLLVCLFFWDVDKAIDAIKRCVV